MTNTSHLQVEPDFYTSRKVCEENTYKQTPQTNPRYKNFTQTHFTAGDEEQFREYMNNQNLSLLLNDIDLKNNIFGDHNISIWHKFGNIEADSIINTFRYIFNKFKKGVYIKIVNNKLKVFLPFSKSSYINEWSKQIKINTTKYKSLEEFLSFIYKQENRKFNPKRINKNISEWFGNNSLVRFEYPVSEGEKTISLVKVMFEELCKHREIPDISFFYNRRDFPLITIDETEPYNHIWGTKKLKLLSHNYLKYCTVFSGSSSERYADLLLPTWDDWARVESFENKWYKGTCKNYDFNFSSDWANKKPTAVFRGSTTGTGFNIETNMRLKAAMLSNNNEKDKDGVPYLDVGITKWNLRPRKHEQSEYIDTIDISKLPFGLTEYLSPEEQSKYKYILNIDGHVSAYRLSLELSMNSVVLLVDSEWKLWFSNKLIPYEHYVPIKADLSNLITQIKWCKENDEKCEKISKNAKQFYQKYLCKSGIFDYLQKILIDVKKHNGDYLYNSISPSEIILINEYKELNYDYPSIQDKLVIKDLGILNRNYSNLLAIEWLIRKMIKENTFTRNLENIGLLFENKLGKVYHKKLLNYNFAVKSTSNKQKIKEHIHETFVGTKITNILSKFVPNFVYIFGLYKQDENYNVVTEKIEGETLFNYLKGDSFNFRQFLYILLQILLALQLSQNKYGFIHYDLTPWNIIIKSLSESIDTTYILNYNLVYQINSDCIPVLIDFGKTHVIYDNINHGLVKLCKVSSCQDFLTLLLNSIDLILTHQHLSKTDLTDLFILSNFITNTKYKTSKFMNIHELKTFCRINKKYNSLLEDDKVDLENLQPLDLIHYILDNFKKYNFGVNILNSFKIENNEENPVQIYKSFYLDSDYDKAISCINLAQEILDNSPPPSSNNIFNIYIFDHISSSINNLLYKSKVLLNDNSKLVPTDNSLIDKLREKYRFKEDYKLEELKNIKETQTELYKGEIFLKPRVIIDLLSKNINTNNYISYREILIYVYLIKNKPYQIEQMYKMNSIKKILNLNPLNHIRYTSSLKTIRFLSKNIYQKDLEWLTNQLQDIEVIPSFCREYIEIYNKLLE
jgi:hypothetical protein